MLVQGMVSQIYMKFAYTEYSVWASGFTINALALLTLFKVFCLAVLIQKSAMSQLAPWAGKVQLKMQLSVSEWTEMVAKPAVWGPLSWQ